MLTPVKEVNELLDSLGSTELKTATTLYDLIKRPELDYDKVIVFDSERPELSKEIKMLVNTEIKYEGYIKKQQRQIEQFKKLENRKIDFIEDFKVVKGLSNEAIQKLNDIRPESVGQASRISGVSPADINVLLIYLEARRRNNDK